MPEIPPQSPLAAAGRTTLTLAIAIVALVLISLLSLLAAMASGLRIGDVDVAFGAPLAIAMLVQNVLMVAFGLTFAPRGAAIPRRVVGKLPAVGVGLACGLAGSFLGMVLALLQSLLGMEVEEQAWILATLERFDLWTALLAVAVVVVAPLGEETFFRRYLFADLEHRGGPLVAALLSAALFAGIHFNLSGLALYFVLGLALALAYRLTGSLIAPLVGHAAHNALTLAIALIAARSGA